MEPDKVQLARDFCIHYHTGQFRKGSNQPYHTHPFAVAEILKRYGYADELTQCVAILHDAVEDTSLDMRSIDESFGYEIANGVYILSKNTIGTCIKQLLPHISVSDDDLYKMRLAQARRKTQRVKIGDMIDNTRDLGQLKPASIERKIHDAESFYIPLGMKIAPIMTAELVMNIANYRKKMAIQ